MKERPILFRGEMVRAILEGRKNQTRRVIKPRHDFFIGGNEKGNPWPFFEEYVYAVPEPLKVPGPYGEIGDRLWVRETWSVNFYGGHSSEAGAVYEHFGIEYRAGGEAKSIELDRHNKNLTRLYDTQRGDWRPSIFMPRWACRIVLEITDIWVERVQKISGEDAMAEGYGEDGCEGNSAYRWYSKLWDSINGKKHPWDSNPWVWAITFKRLEEPA